MELECCGGDDSESVKDLMEMIKERSDGKIDAPWMKLQLFLTKKTDGTWLTQRNVQEDVSVTGDLDPLDDMPAPLNLVGLSEEDVRFRITKENIKAKRSLTMCWWWFLPRTTSTPQPRFFSLRFYPTFSRMPQRLSLTKTELSKIFVQRLWMLQRREILGAIFIRNDMDAFRLKLFDPSIRSTPLINITDRNGNEVFSAEQTRVLLSSTRGFDVGTTFGDVEDSALTFTGLERPFYRCLNLQARVACMVALKKKWIDGSYDFQDFWSEFSLDDTMEMFHRSILNSVAAD